MARRRGQPGQRNIRSCCPRVLSAHDSETLGVRCEELAAVVFEPSDAVVGRRASGADSPVLPQLSSEGQPMKAPAALLEVPLLEVARLVNPPVQPFRPTLVDSPALLIIHMSKCASRCSLSAPTATVMRGWGRLSRPALQAH